MASVNRLWKLRFTMFSTVALIIAITTLALTAILIWFDAFNLVTLFTTVTLFNVLQWLFAPYIVNIMYGVRKAELVDHLQLQQTLQMISQKSAIETPKLMISKLTIPNAFAYGSPLTGNMVAVTDGLLQTLESEEVDAVLGHEVGHLKHRDMQVMMIASFLPSLFYILARSLLYSSWFGGRDRKNDSGAGLALIGGVSMLIYFVLTLLNLGLSRQREYYADEYATKVVPDGARKLSEGLAKISTGTWMQQRGGEKVVESGFKTLFIADPDHAGIDVADIQASIYGSADAKLVEEILRRRVTRFDGFFELFSTHPNIVKRLQVLQSSQ